MADGKTTPDTVGARLERLLRAAEEEGAEIRRTAEKAASALLTQAHVEIDRHERENRDRWNEREAAVVAAEKRTADEWAAAQQRAAELLADTTAQAEAEARRIRGHAYNRAKEITAHAEQAAAETTRLAAEEVDRLQVVREGAREEILRLLRTLDGIRAALAYEIEVATRPVAAPSAVAPPSAKPGRRPYPGRRQPALPMRDQSQGAVL